MNRYAVNSAWLMLDKLLVLGGGLLVYILVSNYLGPDALGKLAFGVALSAVPVTVSQWGSNFTIFNVAIVNKNRALAFIQTTEQLRCAIYILSSIALILVLCFTKYKSDIFFLGCVILAHVFMGLDVYQFYFNARLQSKINAKSNLTSKILELLTRLTFVSCSVSPKLFFIPYFIYNFSCYYNRRRNAETINVQKGRVSRKYVCIFFQSGKYFFASSLLTLAYTKANDIILIMTTSYANLAVYNVAMTLSFAWTFIPLSIGTSYLSRAIESKEDSDFIKLHRYMLISSVPFLIAIYLLSGIIVDLLFHANYSSAKEILFILSVSSFLSTLNVINNRIIGAFGGGSYLTKKILYCSSSSLLISFILINNFGLIGAAYACLITELFNLTIGNYFFKQKFIFRYHFKSIFGVLQ